MLRFLGTKQATLALKEVDRFDFCVTRIIHKSFEA